VLVLAVSGFSSLLSNPDANTDNSTVQDWGQGFERIRFGIVRISPDPALASVRAVKLAARCSTRRHTVVCPGPSRS
jgi:hypothetical protein